MRAMWALNFTTALALEGGPVTTCINSARPDLSASQPALARCDADKSGGATLDRSRAASALPTLGIFGASLSC
jgi:hypothetical protein